ncbi:MAG: hypothetical protein ABIP75_08655 [Pyrinomonadaceae bacterium]
MRSLNPLHSLTRPGFVIGLCLLLLNDFVLKSYFHNWFSGKLSDFAGLFVFPFFFAAFAPRFRRHIYLVTALAFVFWKSNYSEPLIQALEVVVPIGIGRVVDASDLLALVVLPLSFQYGSRLSVKERADLVLPMRRKVAIFLIALVSVFAFTATTSKWDRSVSYHKEYEFEVSREELIRKLFQTDLTNVTALHSDSPMPNANSEERDFFTGHLTQKTCDTTPMAYMDIYSRGSNKSKLVLNFIHYICESPSPTDKSRMLDGFEHDVLDSLRSQQR